MKKITVAFIFFVSANCFATTSTYLTCFTPPQKTETGIQLYEAYVFADSVAGINKMEIYSSDGSTRTMLTQFDVQHKRTQDTEIISNIETGKDILTYKTSEGATRNGLIQITDAGVTTQYNAVCYL